ncbi:PCC domain-containing protein [Chloroflexota bacterium]
MQENYKYLDEIGEGKIGRIIIGKLKIGVDLLDGIEELAGKEDIKTGVIISGIGALEKGIFRNAKIMPPDYIMEDKYRLYVDIENPLELISLSGWIASTRDGDINVHAHYSATTVIDDKLVSLGGHLVTGTITSIKVVVVIGEIEYTNIQAVLDPNINQVNIDFSG